MQNASLSIYSIEREHSCYTARHKAGSKRMLLGALGKLISTFAELHNASLLIKTDARASGYHGYYHERMRQNASYADLACALEELPVHAQTDVLHFVQLCWMLPLPLPMDTYKIYAALMRLNIVNIPIALIFVNALLLELSNFRRPQLQHILLNDKAVRGFLGQSFELQQPTRSSIKLICLLIFFTHLISESIYGSYLQSYVINAPFESKMWTYEHLIAQGVTLLLPSYSSKYAKASLDSAILAKIKYMQNYSEYNRLRNNMHRKYAYITTVMQWSYLAQQQKYFKLPLYYFNNQLCLGPLYAAYVGLRHRLPFVDLFNEHTQRVKEAGLWQHWRMQNFYDLRQLGLFSREDLSIEALRLRDTTQFYYIWLLYICMIAGCCLVFAGELIWTSLKISRNRRRAKK